MKKILLLFVLSGLIFSASSCKKKEKSCPKPEVWGVGTWKASKIEDPNGNVVDPASSAYAQCYVNSEQFTLNDSHDGAQWIWADVDQNTNACTPQTLTITAWAENMKTKRLYITTNQYGSFELIYTNDHECYMDFDYKYYYQKQDN